MGKGRRKVNADSNALAGEVGTIRRTAPTRIALGYPASYKVAASSLGYQVVYRIWNEAPAVVCERFFPDSTGRGRNALVTLESGFPVQSAHAIAFSVASEMDIHGVVALLELCGLSPLRAHRGANVAPVIIGGPLTILDPRLVSPLADVVVVGEGEEALPVIRDALADAPDKETFLASLDGAASGLWIPSLNHEPPIAAHAPVDLIPAFAATWSKHAELKDLFLIEAARGCKRACSFCVMSRRMDQAGPFRAAPVERVLQHIPANAPGVGLVGAAVTDHPDIEQMVDLIVRRGHRVSLSSIRADQLTEQLTRSLVAGGLKSLTLAADGSSEDLRRSVKKGITKDHLFAAVTIAAAHGIRRIKVYSMVGLPGEQDADMEELAGLLKDLSAHLSLSIAVQAFVPKPGTPLANVPMADLPEIRHRLQMLRRLLAGKVRMIPTSPRWSWIDWKIAHMGERAAHAAIEARSHGGTFAAWKRAIENQGEK